MIQNFLNLADEKLKEIDYMIERLEKDHPLRFTRLEKDLCEAVMEVKPEMLNFYEMVYGGQTFNLMDVVAGVANRDTVLGFLNVTVKLLFDVGVQYFL